MPRIAVKPSPWLALKNLNSSSLDAQLSLRKKTNRLGVSFALLFKYPCRQRLGCVAVKNRNRSLQDDWSMIVLIIGEVHRAAAHLHAGLQSCLVHAGAVIAPTAKGRYECRVDVH